MRYWFGLLPTFRPAGSKYLRDKNEEPDDCGKNRRYQNRSGCSILCKLCQRLSLRGYQIDTGFDGGIDNFQAQHLREENHADHPFSHADVQDAAGNDDKRHKTQMNLDVALSADAGPDTLEGISEAFI